MPPAYRRFRSEGFTLLEIMMVVLIIGLLAALAIPNFLSAREKAVTQSCLNNQRLIYDAAVMYELEAGDTLEGMSRPEALQKLLDEGYLRNNGICECPASNVDDLDDYQIIYEDSNVVDVECTVGGNDHKWP